MTPAYAGEEIQVNLLQNTQQKTAAEDEIDLDKLLEENKKIPRQVKEKIKKLNNQIKKNKEMEYINKYVNEETLIQINPERWGEVVCMMERCFLILIYLKNV